MASVKRDRLVNTALQLFTQNGYRATGIDKILDQSGVAKMTLYKHFKSKDELIIAALRQRDEEFMVDIQNSMLRLEKNLQQQCDSRLNKLMIFLQALHEWISGDSFYGCNFINASVEFKRQDDPIHVAAAAHHKLTIQMIMEFIAELHLAEPAKVARQIHMIIQGAIVTAVTIADYNSALLAKDSIIRLLNSCDIPIPLK